MRTLKLVDGDLVFDSLGRLHTITEKEMLIQSLENRLQTYLGDLFYSDVYGIAKFKGKINEDSLLILIKEALMSDDRISDVSLDSFQIINNGVANVNIWIELIDSDSPTLISINVSL